MNRSAHFLFLRCRNAIQVEIDRMSRLISLRVKVQPAMQVQRAGSSLGEVCRRDPNGALSIGRSLSGSFGRAGQFAFERRACHCDLPA
jgi:hypothetical protein